MKKLSLAMLTSLIALGLLFVGSTNAMTYTVDGNETSIAIPKNTSAGITIDRGDSETSLVSECSDTQLLGTTFKQCQHNYPTEGEYQVSVNNNNSEMVVNLYLNNANINEFHDFNGFPELNTIYLQYNKISEIGSNVFDGLSNCVVYLDNNKIESFNSSIANIKYLYLTDNLLTDIPGSIRNYNYGARYIRLSNSVGVGRSGGKFIDLLGNPIKFIKITEVDGNDTSIYSEGRYGFNNATTYQFAWFGYSNEGSTSYDYTLADGNDVTLTEGTTTENSVTLNEPIAPGRNYYFKVCLHGESDKCDRFTIDVDYTEQISFTSTSPNNGATTASINGISFNWQRTGNYPASLVSGYSFTLTKDGTEIDGGDREDGSATYSLDRNLIEDNPNGHYVFTVYLLDKDGNIINYIAPATTSFDIAIDNTVTINSPIGTQLGEEVHSINVNFDWETSSTLFKYYEYYVTAADSCSPSATHLTGGTSNVAHTIFNHTLGIGDYLLCLDMYNTSNNKVNNEPISSDFSVVIPATVDITSPTSTVSVQPIQFSWDIFLPNPYTFRDYAYVVKKGTDDVASDTITNQDNRSFSLNNLRDGTYSVNVTMHYNDGVDIGSVADTKTFTVNSSAGVYLNLTPVDGASLAGDHVSQVPVTLSWEGGGSPLISKYTYKLTNTSTSEIIDSGTKDATDTLSLGTKLLPSGTYRFEVVMLDSDDIEITNSYSDFTVLVPSDLEILSPLDGLSPTKDVIFSRSGFDEFGEHYSYILKKIDDAGNETLITSNDLTTSTSFTMPNLQNGTYTFSVTLIDIYDQPVITKSVTFIVPDSQELTINISDGQHSVTTLNSRTGIFSRGGESENFDSYSYSVVGTTFKDESYSYNGTSRSPSGNFTLNDLSTGRYRFTVTMLDSDSNTITGKYLDFTVAIPATLKITSPANGSTITTSSATFTWSGYSDVITKYDYELTGDPISSTTSTSFSKSNLTNGNYTLTVSLYSGSTIVAQDNISFTVNIPAPTPKPSTGGGGGGGASGKTHYNNNLKVSLGNDSPTTSDWVKLIIKIDEKYTGKVSFPKLQYYSPDTERWIDIPVTSKNYVSEYSDEAKLGYVKFTSDDDGRIDIPQFIKFSKSGFYRIYAEDKDGYDADVEVYVSGKKTTTTTNTVTNNTQNNNTVSNTPNSVNNIIQQFIPEVYGTQDTSEEVYIARSCKRYTITYSNSLKVYTSPNLNISEYFITKDYFKRYIDSKNKYQSGCPTNVGWISTSYVDNSNDNSKYTAPNGKVYFITSQNGKYYSNELNKELKTPTSFNTIQELKYYIRDRNPLISMAALGPIN